MIKIGSFFEEHIEKIVLVIIVILCAILLIFRVLLSPNVIEYDQKKFSPSDIDGYIYEQAKLLRQRLDDAPQQPKPYETKKEEFLAQIDSTLSDIDVTLWPPQPYNIKKQEIVEGIYNLPIIGEVSDVAVEHIRAAAYVPTETITELNPYERAANEPNDIDLVTVEAKFDVKQLYDRFRESFIEDVEEQWVDPCLAKPTFAAVQLQRQELGWDETWSDWQDVPRTKIDSHSRLFKIIEDEKDLPLGGLKVHMLQFDNLPIQMDLLQPQAYQIASAKEEWFPPRLHKRFLELQRKDDQEIKRLSKQERQQQERQDRQEDRRSSRRIDTRSGTGRTSGRTAGRTGVGLYDGLGGSDGLYGGYTQDTRRRSRRDRIGGGRGGVTDYGLNTGRTTRGRGRDVRDRSTTTDGYGYEMQLGGMGMQQTGLSVLEVYNEYDEISLNYGTDLSKMREPIVFWAHDDTIEPRKTYRYRIRLGVFNPIAGNQVSSKDKSQKSNPILWSEFSETTDAVNIPGRLYFFAKDIQEAAKTITVQVYKYVLGYWYSEDFKVSQGEVMGGLVENEPPKAEKIRSPRSSTGRTDRTTRTTLTSRTTTTTRTTGEFTEPEMIDYNTGAVMVDVMTVNDWSAGIKMNPRHYHNMLYSYDGVNIERMPINSRYWAKDLKTVFNEIITLERQTKEPFKAFGTTGRGRRPGPDYEGYEGYDEMMMYPEMMYDGYGYGGYGGG